MKYTTEELNERCEKYYHELIEKGTDMDEVQDLCVIFLENGGYKRVPKWYSKEKAIKEEFEKELVPFAEDNRDAIYYSEPLVFIDELYDNLYKSLSTLSKREITVLRYRFAENLTLGEAGSELKAPRERVRQIEAKALRKLRHSSRSWYLRDYMDLYDNGVFYSIFIDRKSSISSEFQKIVDIFDKAYEFDKNKKERAIEEERIKERKHALKLVLEKESVFGDFNLSSLSIEDIDRLWGNYTKFLLSHPDGVVSVPKKVVTETPYSLEKDFQSKMRKIRRMCDVNTVQYPYSTLNDFNMKYMSNIFNYVKSSILPAIRKMKRNKNTVQLLSNLIDDLKNIINGKVESYNDAYCRLAQTYPSKNGYGYGLAPLFSLNFKWVYYNRDLFPKVLTDKILAIHNFDDIIPWDVTFIDVLSEYDKYTGSYDTKNIIDKFTEFTGNNYTCKCDAIDYIMKQHPKYTNSPFVFITDALYYGYRCSYIVTEKSTSDEWKGKLKKEAIKAKQLSRQMEVRGKREIFKFEGATDGYRKSPRERRLLIGKNILTRVKKDKFIKKDFAIIIARAHRLIYANESSIRMHHSLGMLRDYSGTMLPYVIRYRKFVNENTEWIEHILGNMIKNRIIDIENHKLYLHNQCNLIDKFMESRTIDKTIECIVYKGIDNYDEFGCRYFMLDPHYVALLDIIYMLKVGAGYAID